MHATNVCLLKNAVFFCLPLSSLFHAHEELNWPSLFFKKWKLNRQYALQPDKEFKFYLSCVLLLFVIIYLTQAIMLTKYEFIIKNLLLLIIVTV